MTTATADKYFVEQILATRPTISKKEVEAVAQRLYAYASNKLLNHKEAAWWLSVSATTLDVWRKNNGLTMVQRRLPNSKTRACLYIRTQDLAEWWQRYRASLQIK